MAGGVRERLGYSVHGIFLGVICLLGHQVAVPVMHPVEGFGDGRHHPSGGTPAPCGRLLQVALCQFGPAPGLLAWLLAL